MHTGTANRPVAGVTYSILVNQKQQARWERREDLRVSEDEQAGI